MASYINYFNFVFRCIERVIDIKDYISDLCKNYNNTNEQIPDLKYNEKKDMFIFNYTLNDNNYIYLSERLNPNFRTTLNKIKTMVNESKITKIKTTDYFIIASLNNEIDITEKINMYAGPNGIHLEKNEIILRDILNDNEKDIFKNITLTDIDCNDIICDSVNDSIIYETLTI